jgi:uncharacterized protein YcnI
VGIGTTSPSTLLHLDASADGRVARFGSGTSDTGGMYVTHNSGSTRSFELSADNILILDADRSNGRASSRLQFNVDGTERMRIDSSGNVLIGETSQINGGFLNLATSGASNALSFLCRSTDNGHQNQIIMQKSSTNSGNFAATADNESLGQIIFRGVNTSNVSDIAAFIEVVQDGTSSSTVPAEMRFGTTETERMRIPSDGRILFGCTSEPTNSVSGVQLSNAGTFSSCKFSVGNNVGNFTQISSLNGNGVVGSIKTNAAATAYNTSSDYRLKENVVTDWDATTRLKKLKPSRFNWKTAKDTTLDGFLAHEVSSIVPEAISGEKDAMKDESNVVLNADGTVCTWGVSKKMWEEGKLPTTDEDGKTVDPIYASDTTWVESKSVPDHQAIDQSKLVPLLTKSLQEALARIDTLEAEVKTLKGE